MKKINLNQIKRNLSKLEMNRIMAGSSNDNTNTLMYCMCEFVNFPNITNSNSAYECTCACVRKID